MVANADRDKEDSNTIRYIPKYGGSSKQLLASTVIYGPNAAGKSSLLDAMRAMQRIVLSPGKDVDSELPVEPFRLNRNSETDPTTFQVILVIDGIRYQYGFSVTQQEVISEWLYVWPKGRIQVWLDRDTEEDRWKISEKISGSKRAWREMTRKNALFLTTAVSLNSDDLRPIYNWFRQRLHVFEGSRLSPSFSSEWVKSRDKKLILRFLENADLSIQDLHIEENDVDPKTFEHVLNTGDESETKLVIRQFPRVWLSHLTKEGDSVDFPMSEESDGTSALFNLSGPWLDSLEKGNTLFVDELDTHLHPYIVKYLIERFHDNRSNKKQGQLIFTTHDTSVLNKKIFRRDQIWFCQKNVNGQSTLYPFTDFKPRKDLRNWESSYLNGRYGAVPSTDAFSYSTKLINE